MKIFGRLILGAMVSFSSTTLVRTQSITPTVEPPWQSQTFDFGWDPFNGTVTQCRSLQFQWATRPNAAAQPAPPYTINFWRAGYQPYVAIAGPGSVGTYGDRDYAWIVNLPTDGPYMTSMFDSTGNLGGSVGLFNILPAQGPQCPVQTLTPQSLNLTLSNVRSSCGTIAVNVSGGIPPYKLGVLPDNLPMKFMYYSTGSFDYVLDVPAGMNVFFVVEDSQRQYGVAPSFLVGGSANAPCLTAASTLAPGNPALTSIYPGLDIVATSTASSSLTSVKSNDQGKNGHSIIGLVAGVAAAAVVALALGGFLLWWKCIHRASDGSPTHDIDATYIPYHRVEPFSPTPSMVQVTSLRQTPSTFFTQDRERASLAAQRGDVKSVTPPTPSRSPYTSSTSSSVPTSSSDSRLSGYDANTASGDGSFHRSTASPPLPPGAAPPTSYIPAEFGSEGASSLLPFLLPGAAEPYVDPLKTPPPRYSER